MGTDKLNAWQNDALSVPNDFVILILIVNPQVGQRRNNTGLPWRGNAWMVGRCAYGAHNTRRLLKFINEPAWATLASKLFHSGMVRQICLCHAVRPEGASSGCVTWRYWGWLSLVVYSTRCWGYYKIVQGVGCSAGLLRAATSGLWGVQWRRWCPWFLWPNGPLGAGSTPACHSHP